jgi:hypothetical protein
MDRTPSRELRILKAYAIASSFLMAVFCLAAFTRSNDKARFSEIDVERINVIEKDGSRRLVISGRGTMPGVVMGHQEFSASREVAGMLFYNDEGDEQGGLVFSGKSHDSSYTSTGSLTFDRYKQDQVLGLQAIDENGQSYAGLSIWNRPAQSLVPYFVFRERVIKMPEGPARKAALDSLGSLGGHSAQRVFIGQNQTRAAIINLKDMNGKTRLRLAVDSLGAPRLEFLDEKGKVVYLLRDSTHVSR